MTEQDYCGVGKNESSFCSECYLTLSEQIRNITAIPENQLDQKSLVELQEKFKEYQSQIGVIADLFEITKEEYNDTYTIYSQIFSKLNVLESIIASLDLGALGDEYLELEDTSALATFFTTKDIAGTALSGVGLIYSIYKFNKISKAVKAAAAASETSSIAATSKYAKYAKVTPILSGIVSLAFGGVSIASMVIGNAELISSLKEQIPTLDTWFKQTKTDIISLCTSQREMRTELETLKAELAIPLGVSTDQELLQSLDESLRSAGKFEAVTQILLRILCNDKDKPIAEQTPVATIATITGLPESYITLKKTQVSSIPGFCENL